MQYPVHNRSEMEVVNLFYKSGNYNENLTNRHEALHLKDTSLSKIRLEPSGQNKSQRETVNL